ncbi:N-carbamoyl-L-amino-acid hydrolase (plasmid) [Paracoccus aminophilus JCM 7686]|uniref:N-carbamoyl-L-amino-acid hydrolase n=1 Tax=Paracoccus aminophilus JCM 7686 TaxID=1367847 RepID=S5Z082_PARAH|nr:N-carbamoyl-L-amino-acid hydrolase [Paracoccus aminophilus JCM 7686]
MSGAALSNLRIDTARLGADLAALAEITEPGRPWTRRAFTPKFLEGRAWLEGRMQAAGLTTRIDAAGNLIGRLAGKTSGAGVLMVGSHSDTVPDGGRFDGIAGVLAGLEIARAVQDQGITFAHDLEIVDFLAEEVSIFGVSCVGSRGLSGQLPEDWLSRIADGRDLKAAIAEAGGAIEEATPRADVKGFLELHIEQGPVLEAEGLPIGVVTAIAGITRVLVTVAGRPDHAGTTPMNARQDALIPAAELVLAIRAKADALAAGPGHFTATVGEFRMEPNAANVVPARVEMLIDARASERADMEAFLDWLGTEGARHGAEVKVLSDNPPKPSHPAVCDLLEAAAEKLGAGHRRMVSGAGHDAAWMGRIAPTAMVFVPCAGGRSHCPEEWAETGDIALGAAVMLETLIEMDRLVPVIA